MQRIVSFALLLVFGLSATFAQDEPIINPEDYAWVPVTEGFDSPLYVTDAGDGSGRLFVLEQTGFILVIEEDGTVLERPFLSVDHLLPRRVYQGGYTEQGLLGLAFHPDFETNGQFFISYTDNSGDTAIVRYVVDAENPNRADVQSAEEVFTLDQPFDDHNGGHILFGDDGYLYVGLGDGGSSGDPNANGQNTQNLFGTILRIDVDTIPYTVPEDNPFVDNPDYEPEIWVFGLRNPWRFSFDRADGDLYIGDVGQEAWEEIDHMPADEAAGTNFGWDVFEATHPHDPDTELASEPTDPIFEYSHDIGCSVTGGYVYRGDALPELDGVYFYADYCSGNIWAAYQDADDVWQNMEFMKTDFVISSFGEDAAGELYLVDYKGTIYRLERAQE
jgi:glucose/arabinose dehydrogenase